MLTSVSHGVGICGSLEKRDGKLVFFTAVTVLAIVEKGYTIISFGKVSPLVTANFELHFVPACVLVSRSFEITELNVACKSFALDVNGECRLQKNMIFVPVDMSVEVNS